MNQTRNIAEIKRNTESVSDYLTGASAHSPSTLYLFTKRLKEYQIDEKILEKLKKHASKFVLVVFSGEWCANCARNVPILGLVAEATGLEVRVFGHLNQDPLKPGVRWRIPPSPPEVHDFNVVRIPHIAVFNAKGTEVDVIIENPPEGQSLEGVLLRIFERN